MCSYGCVLMIYYLPRTLPVPRSGPLRRRSVRSQDCAFAIRWRLAAQRRGQSFMLTKYPLVGTASDAPASFEFMCPAPVTVFDSGERRVDSACAVNSALTTSRCLPAAAICAGVWPDPSTACMTRMTSYRLSILSSIEVIAAARGCCSMQWCALVRCRNEWIRTHVEKPNNRLIVAGGCSHVERCATILVHHVDRASSGVEGLQVGDVTSGSQGAMHKTVEETHRLFVVSIPQQAEHNACVCVHTHAKQR